MACVLPGSQPATRFQFKPKKLYLRIGQIQVVWVPRFMQFADPSLGKRIKIVGEKMRYNGVYLLRDRINHDNLQIFRS